MLERSAGGQIGADAEVRLAQILDQHVAVLSLQQPRDFAAARQRHEREGVIVHGVGVDEASAVAQPHFVVAPSHRDAGRDDRADARRRRRNRCGTRASRSARMMPRCAKPRAPPPDSTRPTPRRVSRRATLPKSAGVDDVMMQGCRHAFQPTGGRIRFEAPLMQQRQFDARAACDRRLGDAAGPWARSGRRPVRPAESHPPGGSTAESNPRRPNSPRKPHSRSILRCDRTSRPYAWWRAHPKPARFGPRSEVHRPSGSPNPPHRLRRYWARWRTRAPASVCIPGDCCAAGGARTAAPAPAKNAWIEPRCDPIPRSARSSSSLSRSATTVALRCSLEQPAGFADQLAALDLGGQSGFCRRFDA